MTVETGAFTQAIGRTKGGRNTKVHAISDAHCRPLAFYLTPGQTADIKGAVMLVDHLPDAQYLLADKGSWVGISLLRPIHSREAGKSW